MNADEQIKELTDQVTALQEQLAEVFSWYQERRVQQVAFPLDDASKAAIGLAPGGKGTSSLTQSYSVVGGGGGTITGPVAFAGSVFLYVNGRLVEVPFISSP